MVAVAAEQDATGVILFAFAYPGACGWGPSAVAARERLRTDLRDLIERLRGAGLADELPPFDPDGTIEVAERVPATGDPLVCDTEGYFAFDRRHYTDGEVELTRSLLGVSRRDLHGLVDALPTEVLDHRLVADRRTVREIVDHVAIADHWYLTRISIPVDVPEEWRAYSADTFDRLAETRADVVRTLDALPSVPREARARSWTVDGERWSRRKLLRRLVWHERLHTRQLDRLVPKVVADLDGPEGPER